MRWVVAGCLILGVWLLIGGHWDGRRGFDQVVSSVFEDTVDDDAPSWGDVATKIGELSEERKKLTLEPASAESEAEDGPPAN